MEKRLARQSFLGPDSPRILSMTRLAIVGLGGGGSHVTQQAAHIGVGDFLLLDPDHVEDTNLNRMVGATLHDVRLGTAKVLVMERMIKAINPQARVRAIPEMWQKRAELLRDRDVIFGCLDSFSERDQLERMARRYLIPYIDIGMDVCEVEDGFSIGGQTVLSMPEGLCLRCYGIVTDKRLALEAEGYGAAGHRPQVVWANGVLASTAIGIFVQMLCPWRDRRLAGILREFDGESHVVTTSNRLSYLASTQCPHFSDLSAVGDPFWTPEYTCCG